MKINPRHVWVAAQFGFLLVLFLLLGVLSLVLGLIGEAATWAADTLCDVAEIAVKRGRKLRAQMQ